MTRESWAIMGSGTAPLASCIRAGVVQSDGSVAEGARGGTNVIILNPEDSVCSPFMATSGAILENGQILPLSGLIPYRRSTDVHNIGPYPVLIYTNQNIIDEYAYPIFAGNNKEFKVMNGVTVYAKASGGLADIRWYET